jgi:hypothetical protein
VSTDTPPLVCGLYLLTLCCPECGESQPVLLALDTRLTVDGGGARLAAKLNAKPVDHWCRQPALPDPPADGDPVLDYPLGAT